MRISPLGVARRATPPPPRAWRVLPLLAGFAELWFFTVHGIPASVGGQVPVFVVAAVAMGTGLGATAMYASLEMRHPMVAPGPAY